MSVNLFLSTCCYCDVPGGGWDNEAVAALSEPLRCNTSVSTAVSAAVSVGTSLEVFSDVATQLRLEPTVFIRLGQATFVDRKKKLERQRDIGEQDSLEQGTA